ncbi:hypothetical protein [Chrysanthemum yellows phytoplasma]|uniref:hypothetical protein n=1 Tax=Chrysanthemum yellows phytoplasma TaxID=238674 RepID=UPI00054CC524|nr:hypothetical protein [Chrysanthemum yellows phytoplasma]
MQNILTQELKKPTITNLESISELTDAQILEQIINPQKITQIQKELDLIQQRNNHFQEPLDSQWIKLLQNPFNKWQIQTLNKIDIFAQNQIIQDNNTIFNQNMAITLDKINKIIIMEYNGPQKLLIQDKENFLGNLILNICQNQFNCKESLIYTLIL